MAKQPKRDLKLLPRHIIKESRHWWINSKTGAKIPDHKIEDYLPIKMPDHEYIMSKRHDLNY